ncbi:MAG: Ppx/GppA family phosphatase [Planctomycetes bacterium]|nr:Ppx/GppA family phosphatase [Planctomycetota bacterium]
MVARRTKKSSSLERRPPLTPSHPAEVIAAVDLGSNSFHLVVARVCLGVPVVVDRLREQVQFGAGIDRRGRIISPVRQRALACLARFGQRLRSLSTERVRAVATHALRTAKASRRFREAAEHALGAPIEVISGARGARLVYLGVCQSQPATEGRRLVIDIGGGSTECILGEGFEPLESGSLPMGCVSFTKKYFPSGVISRGRFDAAVMEAALALRGVARRFRRLGWSRVSGTSGTIRAVSAVLRGTKGGEGCIAAAHLLGLREEVLAAGRCDRLLLDGLKADRAPIFCAGLAILTALFDSLGIERMEISPGALREGVLFDLLGRLRHEDVRDRTIRQLQHRFHVDAEHAARVERTALDVLGQVAEPWDLEGGDARNFLAWASRMHEIGLDVTYDQHHQHGAYLARHADMPGFSRDDQELLATLVEAHRRKATRRLFAGLPPRTRTLAVRLTALLRLAVHVNRDRTNGPAPPLLLTAWKNRLGVRFMDGWLSSRPMTRTDLTKEREILLALGIRLETHTSG